MKPNSKERLAVAIGALGEAYRQALTEATIRAYAMGLEGIPIDAIERAIKKAIQTSRFFPTPAELRDLAGAGAQRLEDQAALAFENVAKAVQSHGYYDTVKFDDPVTNSTVEALWINWMATADAFEHEDRKWLRKDFIAAYCVHARNGVKKETPLLGFYDQENQLHGYGATEKVLLIGNSGEVKRLAAPGPTLQLAAPDLAAGIGRMAE